MLQYKCAHAGVWYEEVDEAYSTQTCSCCGSRTGPKGVAGLGIRGWQCSVCETVHDRDTNAAKNILAAGRGRLAGGTPGCCGPESSSRAARGSRQAEGEEDVKLSLLVRQALLGWCLTAAG